MNQHKQSTLPTYFIQTHIGAGSGHGSRLKQLRKLQLVVPGNLLRNTEGLELWKQVPGVDALTVLVVEATSFEVALQFRDSCGM